METTKIKQVKQDTRTEFEKRHWEEAQSLIPKNAKLISVSPTTCRVEKLGIFYRLPGETSNHYISPMTKNGKWQAEMITGIHEIKLEIRSPSHR